MIFARSAKAAKPPRRVRIALPFGKAFTFTGCDRAAPTFVRAFGREKGTRWTALPRGGSCHRIERA